MSLLYWLSYGAIVGAFAFITLSLASGLLYISELIEEHSRLSKLTGQRGIYAIIAIHLVLYWTDSLPFHLILFSIACHVVYLQNFTSLWPYISLTSVSFMASCVLVVVDHFLWFFYFSRRSQDARHNLAHHGRNRAYSDGQNIQPALGFAEVATFFAICVWLSPLFLFLSLSANDNALPMATGEPGTPTIAASRIDQNPRAIPPARSSLFKTLVDAMPRIRPKSRRKDSSEGIIAPRSPMLSRPSSPNPGASILNHTGLVGTPRSSFESPPRTQTPPSFQLSPPPRRDSTRVGLGLRRATSSMSASSGSGLTVDRDYTL